MEGNSLNDNVENNYEDDSLSENPFQNQSHITTLVNEYQKVTKEATLRKKNRDQLRKYLNRISTVNNILNMKHNILEETNLNLEKELSEIMELLNQTKQEQSNLFKEKTAIYFNEWQATQEEIDKYADLCSDAFIEYSVEKLNTTIYEYKKKTEEELAITRQLKEALDNQYNNLKYLETNQTITKLIKMAVENLQNVQYEVALARDWNQKIKNKLNQSLKIMNEKYLTFEKQRK